MLRKIEPTSPTVIGVAEYIWIDATNTIRSKARVIEVRETDQGPTPDLPWWAFDGSSTGQADGGHSDLILSPCHFVEDPIRGKGCYLVLCEIRDPDGKNHPTNTRARLRAVLDHGGEDLEPWWGFEQEYFLFRPAFRDRRGSSLTGVAGWPVGSGEPGPQGPYYCGVGADRVAARKMVEDHMSACLQAGLLFHGVNAEVALGQWEFQIGYRGFEQDKETMARATLNLCDHLWFARYLLQRMGEEHGLAVTYDPKPLEGDWNGSGMHTNFSTAAMRERVTGRQAIQEVIQSLEANHDAHIEVYGEGNDRRLTGKHETARIDEFRHGALDRGASVRVPPQTANKGYGYIEDRRPAANADPYEVCARILRTVLGLRGEPPLAREDRARYLQGGLTLLDGGKGA